MNDQEFQALAERVESGETLPVVEQVLYEMECRHRAQPLNRLQQQAVDRQKNRLSEPRKWSIG